MFTSRSWQGAHDTAPAIIESYRTLCMRAWSASSYWIESHSRPPAERMSQEHEYTLLGGVNRAKVGRYLALVSAGVSGAITFFVLAPVDVARRFHLPINLPPEVLSLIGAGSVFGVLYWVLNRYAWRWVGIAQWLNVPNLAGEWTCNGETIEVDGTVKYAWQGALTITQTRTARRTGAPDGSGTALVSAT